MHRSHARQAVLDCAAFDTELSQTACELHAIVTHIACCSRYGNGMNHGNNTSTFDAYQAHSSMFNPTDYIKLNADGYAMCTNPMADGGLEAIMVNTRLAGEGLRNFESSIKRMVLSKLFSPKFGEVILTATRLSSHESA
jgi:hypothetical protein